MFKSIFVILFYCIHNSSNEFGTPFFTSLLSSLEAMTHSTFVGYMNCDLLLHSSFFESLHYVSSLQESGKLKERVMIMGRRYNVNMDMGKRMTDYHLKEFDQHIINETQFSDLFISVAQDFFIYNRGVLDLSSIPDLVVGRNGYDNYLVNFCHSNHIPIIDISHSGNINLKDFYV